jgi:hypothetical protein
MMIYMIIYDMIWWYIWYDTWYDIYDMIYDMIYFVDSVWLHRASSTTTVSALTSVLQFDAFKSGDAGSLTLTEGGRRINDIVCVSIWVTGHLYKPSNIVGISRNVGIYKLKWNHKLQFNCVSYRNVSYRNVRYRNVIYRNVSYHNVIYRNVSYQNVIYRNVSYQNVIYRNVSYSNCEPQLNSRNSQQLQSAGS